MATGKRVDPLRGYNFRVEVDGVARNGFREVAGLDITTDVIDYREGNEKTFTPRKLAGMVKYSTITLKNGITDDTSLYDWRKKTVEGKTERKNGSIIVMDEAGEEKLRYNFVEAWPSKYSAPTFNATGNEVAIETLEITHEGLAKA